ncbi:MAG TPA: toast rack family protein, partial [Bacteroidota bacterium]|nr:toast rack family protein [Bacteroidota bacterium]
MMNVRFPYILIVTGALVLAVIGCIFYKASNTYKKDIPLSREQELKVTINAGYGDMYLSRGTGAMLLQANIDAELKHDLDDYIDYSSRDNVGYLIINTSDENYKSSNEHNHSIHFNGFGTNTWDMHFTDAIPISYDVELGVGKADFDFTGLSIKDLNLSTGASSVDL